MAELLFCCQQKVVITQYYNVPLHRSIVCVTRSCALVSNYLHYAQTGRFHVKSVGSGLTVCSSASTQTLHFSTASFLVPPEEKTD